MFCWKPCIQGRGRAFFETKRHIYYVTSHIYFGGLTWYLPIRFTFPGYWGSFLYVKFLKRYFTFGRLEKLSERETSSLRENILRELAWDRKKEETAYQREAITTPDQARHYAGLWLRRGLLSDDDLKGRKSESGTAFALRCVVDKVCTPEKARQYVQFWIGQGLLGDGGCREDLIELHGCCRATE